MLSGKIVKIFKILVIIISISIIGGVAYYILADNEVVDLNMVPEVESSVEFQIKIPQVELEKKVIANVDPRNESIYKDAFRKGVAHGLGTKFPDEIGNTYLYAHSTREVEDIEENAGWFTRIDELKVGDEFEIIYGQNIYKYSVASREIIDPRATGVYTAYAPVQMVTLQTCYPRGEIEERLIVKALLLESTPRVDSAQKTKRNTTLISQGPYLLAHHQPHIVPGKRKWRTI